MTELSVKAVQSTSNDHQLAEFLAERAGGLLRRLRAKSRLRGAALGAAGDAVAHEWISTELAVHRPDDAVLSEEATADPARLTSDRVWIVDPLDGSREYGEGRADWAVHVALTCGGRPIAAAVSLPATGRTYTTGAPAAPVSAPLGPVRIAVSRGRCPGIAASVADQLGAELVRMGSAGAKAMAVVRGDVHAYLHAGGQYEWDSAAPAGVATWAGLHASRIDGAPLRYNKPDPYLPDLLICRAELATCLLDAIRPEIGRR